MKQLILPFIFENFTSLSFWNLRFKAALFSRLSASHVMLPVDAGVHVQPCYIFVCLWFCSASNELVLTSGFMFVYFGGKHLLFCLCFSNEWGFSHTENNIHSNASSTPGK